MSQPNISIIMSEYKTNPSFLRTAVESILNQTYKDFELIIVLDGVNKKSEDLLKSYDDKRIILLQNATNKGLVFSLNRALEHAKGEYIARMDTDDIAYPERLEKQYAFMKDHLEYSVVGSLVTEFDETGHSGTLGEGGEKLAMNVAMGDALIHPSVLMKRVDVVAVGGYPDYPRAEDLALWCELLLAKKRLYVMSDILLKYRVNTNDYKKRKLKYRKGELLARLHYYPKLKVNPWAYTKIIRSIVAGIVPTNMVAAYRKKHVIDTNESSVKHAGEKPLVSIIIPAYNASQFLQECLDSIKAQTYYNLEVIIINDGSTDDTLNIAKKYAECDTRFTVSSIPNGGVSNARNQGIKKAQGAYITFIDADDLVVPTFIENLTLTILRTASDMVACAETRVKDVMESSANAAFEPYSYGQKEAILKLLYPSEMGNGPYAKLIKTSLVKKTLFDTELSIAEDLEWNYRLLKKVKLISTIDAPFYFYRPNPSSAMLRPFTIQRMDGLTATGHILDDAKIVGDKSIIIAAQSRHFIEAVFIGMRIVRNQKFKKQYQECKKVIKALRYYTLQDKYAVSSHRLVALTSIINIPFALWIYKMRGSIITKLREQGVAK